MSKGRKWTVKIQIHNGTLYNHLKWSLYTFTFLKVIFVKNLICGEMTNSNIKWIRTLKLCELYEYELSSPFTKVSSLLRGYKKYLVFIRSDSSLDNFMFSIALKIYELVLEFNIKQKTISVVKMFKGKSLWSFLRFFHFPVILQKATVSHFLFFFLYFFFQMFIAESFRGSPKT